MRRNLNIAPHPDPPRTRGGSSSPVYGGGLKSAILTSPHPYPLNNKTPIGYPYPYYGTT